MSAVTSRLKKAYGNPLVRRLLPSSSLRSLRSEHANFLGNYLDLVGSERHEKESESGRTLTTSARQEVKPSGSQVATGTASILPHRVHLKSDFLPDTSINSRR